LYEATSASRPTSGLPVEPWLSDDAAVAWERSSFKSLCPNHRAISIPVSDLDAITRLVDEEEGTTEEETLILAGPDFGEQARG
jgi:hypothetical protein